MTDAVNAAKQMFREQVWQRLEDAGAAVPPGSAYGGIPNFVGADAAAERLADLESWRKARVVKANPDWAQLPVRVRALQDGKLVYMAVPRLASIQPFFVLDPGQITEPYEDVAAGARAADYAPTIGLGAMRRIDLVVCGSVSVNRAGTRIGKGAGYSDIEVALLIDAGLVGPWTTIVTTVHQVQVVDDELPEASHDFAVDVIITPDETACCQPPRRPAGIVADRLTAFHRESIPLLRKH